MLYWITNYLTFTFTLALVGWITAFIIHQEFNMPYRIKRMLKIVPTTYVKILDCYPCFAFWITLAISFEPCTAILVYGLSILTERK